MHSMDSCFGFLTHNKVAGTNIVTLKDYEQEHKIVMKFFYLTLQRAFNVRQWFNTLVPWSCATPYYAIEFRTKFGNSDHSVLVRKKRGPGGKHLDTK
jgi:hypothetical protein